MEASFWSGVAPDGVFSIPGANVLFLEPSLMLDSSYSYFALLPSLYYSRSFFLSPLCHQHAVCPPRGDRKKKKRKRKTYSPNLKEQRAAQRHLEIRDFLFDAYRAFTMQLEVPSLVECIKENVLNCPKVTGIQQSNVEMLKGVDVELVDFVKLGCVWQAPLYDISLSRIKRVDNTVEGKTCARDDHLSTSPLFNHVIENNCDEEILGMCVSTSFLLPKQSRFLISDYTKIQQLIPSDERDGYNLVLVDPPWENKSVHRRALYQTIPNKNLLSLPLQRLVHPEGALVGLWVTNSEKIRSFVDNELFPAWGVDHAVTWYWLKIKSNGEMVSELDLAHHKPYECLALGYICPQKIKTDVSGGSHQAISDVRFPSAKVPPDKRVLISIPGDHSRKPPVGLLLSPYVPGHAPTKGLELFARELNPGWTSWGNEPLHFQQFSYFRRKLKYERS